MSARRGYRAHHNPQTTGQREPPRRAPAARLLRSRTTSSLPPPVDGGETTAAGEYEYQRHVVTHTRLAAVSVVLAAGVRGRAARMRAHLLRPAINHASARARPRVDVARRPAPHGGVSPRHDRPHLLKSLTAATERASCFERRGDRFRVEAFASRRGRTAGLPALHGSCASAAHTTLNRALRMPCSTINEPGRRNDALSVRTIRGHEGEYVSPPGTAGRKLRPGCAFLRPQDTRERPAGRALARLPNSTAPARGQPRPSSSAYRITRCAPVS